MAGKVSTRTVADRRVVAHPAGTTAPTQKADSANSNSTPSPLADHLAQVLTGKKKLAPTPEFLDLEAKVKKAWAEGWRGFEKKEFRERDELFGEPLLKVVVKGHVMGHGQNARTVSAGEILIDRLDEMAGLEGVTVS